MFAPKNEGGRRASERAFARAAPFSVDLHQMDIDACQFFTDGTRCTSKCKSLIREAATRLVHCCAELFRHLGVQRVTSLHARLAVYQLIQEPYTRWQRDAIHVQRLRVRSMHRVIAKMLDAGQASAPTVEAAAKSADGIFRSMGLECTEGAIRVVAAFVDGVCGIALHSTQPRTPAPPATRTTRPASAVTDAPGVF